MITRLKGTLLEKQELTIVIEVGGIGYELEVPLSTFQKLPDTGAEIILFTHYFIREDAHVLYGFSTPEERTLFRQLIKINGVGPKLAMSVLSHLSVSEFVKLVQAEKIAALTQIPGVGKKTAERLLIELRDKLAGLFQNEKSAELKNIVFNRQANTHEDATTALISLGFKPQEASYLLMRVEKPGLSSEEMIRLALKQV